MRKMETVGAIYPIIFWVVILGGIGFGLYRFLKRNKNNTRDK
ncbi:hypothetical protein [Neobacillus niacini]|jgi:hypothetical protein|nr:hypothetical protein [Neobacillus niacini]